MSKPAMAGISRRAVLAGGLAASLLPLTGARGQSGGAVNFAGETIEWFVPFAEGGGTDVWARFFAPFLSRYLPGEPNVLVRNVPGGGSITGTNEFAARARPDGLTLIATSGSTQFPFLLGDANVRYDYANFSPLLASPNGGVVYLPASANVSSAAELGSLGDRQLVFGSQGATSLDLVPMLAFHILGLNVRHVFGMTGRGDARLAFERGEATIDYQTSSGYLTNVTPMVEAGDAVPLFTWGVLDEAGNVVRDPTFPDLPHFIEAYEMMHDAPPSGLAFDAYMAFFGSGFAAKNFALLPLDTPQEIKGAYVDAFTASLNDPDLDARKDDILGDYVQAVASAEVQQLYEVATTIPDDARSWVREFLSSEYSVTF